MVKKITAHSVLRLLLINGKIHQSQIARDLKKPRPTVRKWLNSFEIEGIVKKSELGSQTFYELNYDNDSLVDHMIISEKYNLLKRCDEELLLKELVYLLRQRITPHTCVILFGSAVDSLAKANDIDILVVGQADMKGLDTKINRKPHLVQVSRLDKISATLKQEIIKKHLIVNADESTMRWLLSVR